MRFALILIFLVSAIHASSQPQKNCAAPPNPTCDPSGKTYSTACVQASFDAPGQTVELPAGTFLVGGDTNLILPPNKTIRGQGQGITTLLVAGGTHIPISTWSIDISVTPAILTVNLACAPFNGQLYNTNSQDFTSAFSVTSSSVTRGLETVAYKVYAGVPPVVGQHVNVVMMSGTSGDYVITSSTGGLSGSFTFATSHGSYTIQSEHGVGAAAANGTTYPHRLSALYYASGSAINGYAETTSFDGGVPNFGTSEVKNGTVVGPMFTSSTIGIPAIASSFKMAVTVPRGAAASGVGGYWVISTPSITAYDHRNGTVAHNYILRDLTIAGPAAPGVGEQSYSPYTLELANNDVTPSVYTANAQFLNVTFQNLAGRAAIDLNKSNGILAKNLRFLNIAATDITGVCASNVVIDGIVSTNTGWSSGTQSDSSYSAAVNMDADANCKAGGLLIDNYYFKPAVNGTTAPYPFGITSATYPVKALGFNGATIRNSTLDNTGETFIGGEFFTGGANNLTLTGNKTLGVPMAVEVSGDNFIARNNSQMFYVFAFGQGTAIAPSYTSPVIDHNSLVFHSSTRNSGNGVTMMNFSGWGPAKGVTSCVWDRISITNNNFTIVFDPTGTPGNFIAHMVEFGDGEGGTGCTFTNAHASHNTMKYQGTRPAGGSNTDAMFVIDTPVTGSSGLTLDHNVDTGGVTLRHLVVKPGSRFTGLTLDSSEKSSNNRLIYDESGGTLLSPLMRDNVR